jgi:glycosyltransferase involved in cell wall biosynthesis
MKIVLLAPSHKSFISNFLPNVIYDELPEGYFGAPFVGTIIQELLSKNHIIIAITTSIAINGDYSIKKYKYNNFTWIVVPARPRSISMNGRKLGKIVDFFSFEQKNMIAAIQGVRPDFVHAHWSYEFAGAAVKSGYPCLVTVHDNAYQVFRYFKNIYRFGRLLMSEKNLRKVKFASTVSPYMQRYVNNRCEFVKVIPNPTVVNLQTEDIEKMVNSKMDTLLAPRILMINNGWDARKNGKVGLQAFQAFQKIVPGASLHLYGGGSEVNGLAYRDAAKLGVENIFFNGPIPYHQLIEVIKESHLLVHPAKEESFGLVLIEAMSYGVPTIGGHKSGAVPWVIQEKQLLVDVSKPQAMTDKMIEILVDAILYKKIALGCYNNVANRFSSYAVVDSYLDYYQQILAKK